MLPSFTLAFTGGLVLGSFVPYFPLSIFCLLLAIGIGTTVLEARDRICRLDATVWFCCLLIGVAYWSIAVQRESHPSSIELESTVFRDLTGRIIAPVQQAPDRSVFLLKVDPPSDGGDRSLIARVTWRLPARALLQGDRIRLRARLKSPGGTLNPNGFDYAAYLERQGIDGAATVTGLEGIEFLESGRENIRWRWWNKFDRWRGIIREAARNSLSQPALGLFLGIVIGERGYLEQDLRDQFMITGTVHLLSISGSHLGLVAILTFLGVKRMVLLLPSVWLLGLSRRIAPARLAACATAFPVTAYACLAGAELATIRSLVMLLVALMAKWLGCEQRMFHALAVAAVGILLHDPRAVYDISFQLSFLSVWAIAWWLSRPVVREGQDQTWKNPWHVRCLGWGRDAVVMSAVITLATVPLVAFYFNQLSWLGLFTNLVAVPVMGVILVPLGLMSALWEITIGGGKLPLGSTLQWSMDRFVNVLSSLSAVPGGEWHLASPSVVTMMMFYGMYAIACRRIGANWIRWISSAGLVLILLWWSWSPRFVPGGERFRVTFLDVAQGDSAVLELPDGQVVLIDGGTTYERFDMGRGVVAPFLWNRGIRTIDHVVATHPQLDHMGGLAWVLRHFTVRNFWGTGDVREDLFYQRLQQALMFRGLKEQVAHAGQQLVASGSCRLDVLNSPEGGRTKDLSVGWRKDGKLLNNRSLATELTCGRHRLLLMADVEQEALWRMGQRIERERVDVVKVPHHGAASSLERNWLARVRPLHAVISVGRHNPYGHPALSVLEAYAAQGTSLYRTDRDGGVWVTGSHTDEALQLHRTKDEKLEPVVPFRCLWSCELANWGKTVAIWQS